MEVFRGASGIRIRRANFSNVGRDQINYTTTHIHNTIIHGGQGRLARRANALELSEYTEVKRGDIDKIWDIYYTKQHKSRTKGVEEDIYIAEITMDHSTGHTRKLTVQTFYGPLAKKRWSREYSKFSRDRNVRLFGYNKSSIPSLIFHGELVPLAHFQDRLGMLGRFYTLFLLGSLHCAQNELWFNPTNGKMCRGPAGPPSPKLYHLDISHFDVTVPPTIDVFEDNMITRYFACSRLGVLLFAAISLATHSQRMGYITEPHVVRAVSDLTHSTIAVSQEAQWRSFQDNLDFIQVMPNGTTRSLG
ncbi:hypothetical protein L218DRAFT_130328 [Marasmius fiardii PR-910]|nr:hypothetical protein L218DRAFT_130328 [Marasmius fiardii PR-910]